MLWPFGFVFGVQLGSLEKRKRGVPGTCRTFSYVESFSQSCNFFTIKCTKCTTCTRSVWAMRKVLEMLQVHNSCTSDSLTVTGNLAVSRHVPHAPDRSDYAQSTRNAPKNNSCTSDIWAVSVNLAVFSPNMHYMHRIGLSYAKRTRNAQGAQQLHEH